MAKLNIIGPGYNGRSKNINASRCINFFPEINSGEDKSVASLVGTFGTLYWQDGPKNIRGMHVFNDLIYFVSGNGLYSVNINKVVSGPLGDSLNTTTGRVVFSNNGLGPTGGNQLLFSDGSSTYCYDVSTDSTTTLDIPSSVNCFINSYFVAEYGSGGRFRWSDLNDGSTWNAANFATAESSPDNLISVFNNHGELWLFGEYTTEVYYLTGNSSSPFALVSGGVIDYGCAARYSVSQCDNTIYWLGTVRNNDQAGLMGVFKAVGYGVELVSPVPINYKFSQYNVVSDAFAYSFSDQGHEFYVLTFPGENATWVYDTTTRLWHEWSTYSDDPYKVNRHLSNGYVRFFDRHFVSDYRNNHILELSDKYYTDNGDPIASVRIGRHLYDSEHLENIFISELQLDMETGGIESDQKILKKQLFSNIFNYPNFIIKVGNYLYISDSNNYVFKLEQKTGNLIESIYVGNRVYTILNIDDDNLVFVGGGYVHKYNIAQNEVIFSSATFTPDSGKSIYSFGYVWIPCGTYTQSKIGKYDPTNDTFEVVTTSSINSQFIVEGGNYLYVGLASYIDKIDPTTNSILDSFSLPSGPNNKIYYSSGYIWYVTSGEVYKLSVSDDSVTLCTDVGGSVGGSSTKFEYNEGFLYFSSQNDQYVYKLKISDNTFEDIVLGSGLGFYDMKGFNDFIFVSLLGNDDFLIINKIDNSVSTSIYSSSYLTFLMNDNDDFLYSYESNNIDSIFYFSFFEYENKVLLSWSNDGGNTWSKEHEASIGKIGEYNKRVIWRRLGQAKNKTFRFAISSPVKKVLLDQYIEVER